MERKLVKQGRNALTVTLPAEWIKKKGLTQEDVVHVEMNNNSLTINTSAKSKRTEITIDVRGQELSSMWHAIIGRYIEGYDQITILHDNYDMAQRISQHLIGMVIVEHNQSRTLVKSIIDVPESNIDVLFTRVLHMFSHSSELLIQVAQGKLSYASFKEHERLLDSTILYAQRHLNKYESIDHAYKYFLHLSTIESAGDQLSVLAKYMGRKTRLAELIAKYCRLYVQYLLAHDFKKLYVSLRQFRNSVQQKTFTDGIAYALAENLYNNIGYLSTDT